MAPARRPRLSSVSVPVTSNTPPPVSALFLINFDVKAGYTIIWKRTEPEIELEGLVEYKSLPSGLHSVRDDLIYFVKDNAHAGLSAFVNEPCDEEDLRNARMIAVGILVPLSYGRLGRAWRHAEALKDMAAKLAKDPHTTEILEQYWQSHNSLQSGARHEPLVPSLPTSPLQEHKIQPKKRTLSDANMHAHAEHKLSSFHPAWSLAALLDKFGPLIFPIHRAALLRKRILISCHAPVHQICDFVYNISVLSNIPVSLLDTLPPSAASKRLRPLFTIGVHDIPFLEAYKRSGNPEGLDDESNSGWIACTTDSILAMKDTLWDVLITVPPDYSAGAKEKVWPVVECPGGRTVKATQRDLRRFNALRSGLANMVASTARDTSHNESSNSFPESPLSDHSAVRLNTSHSHRLVRDEPEEVMDRIIEPQSWASLAYNGFMWWASAGEQLRSEEQDEAARDAGLLPDRSGPPHSPMSIPALPTSRSELLPTDSIASLIGDRNTVDNDAHMELAIIAYFHRLTTQILTVTATIVDSDEEAYPNDGPTNHRFRDGDSDDDDVLSEDDGIDNDADTSALRGTAGNLDSNEDGQEDADSYHDTAPITIDNRSMENMGLDVWSSSDAAFVQELVARYFGRDAKIEGKGVEVCGVRVC